MPVDPEAERQAALATLKAMPRWVRTMVTFSRKRVRAHALAGGCGWSAAGSTELDALKRLVLMTPRDVYESEANQKWIAEHGGDKSAHNHLEGH